MPPAKFYTDYICVIGHDHGWSEEASCGMKEKKENT